MTTSAILPVNFTISQVAKAAIVSLRQEYNAQSPHDPAAVLSVSWGRFMPHSGPQYEAVVMSFYPQSQLADVAHGIQQVSGLDVIFFTTPQHHGKFAGKVLDHAAERGFFLNDR